MVKTNMRALVVATGVAALMLGGAGHARAEDVDHSKMDHGAATQWTDPGKQAAPTDAVRPGEAPKADDHSKHEGMNHGGMGGMGGMGGAMGGMDRGAMGGMDHGKSGAGGMMGGMSHGGGSGGGMMQQMMCGFADHLEGRIAYLKAELKLTDAQTGAWSTFADAWRGAAQKAQQKCAASDMRMDHSKPPVLHKLGMMESHMNDHLEIVRAQKAAIEGLFTSLSDEQKKIASETFTSIMKVGMSMMGGMSHGGGGMGGMQH